MTSKSFFFQAEDGIRGRDVTGVQTCALPISLVAVARADDLLDLLAGGLLLAVRGAHELIRLAREALEVGPADGAAEIGRASCRERVSRPAAGGSITKTRPQVTTSRLRTTSAQ